MNALTLGLEGVDVNQVQLEKARPAREGLAGLDRDDRQGANQLVVSARLDLTLVFVWRSVISINT